MAEIFNISDSKKTGAITAADNILNKSDNPYRKIANELLKESEQGFFDSHAKEEQAKQFLYAADALEKMADFVKKKAIMLKNDQINEEEAVKTVKNIVEKHGLTLEIPIPKNATPEILEQIADKLERKAKEYRLKADELLKDAERIRHHAEILKNQAEMIMRKDDSLSLLHLKTALAHNEGLRMIFKKLGIYKLDNEYKEHLAYAEKKVTEQNRLSY